MSSEENKEQVQASPEVVEKPVEPEKKFNMEEMMAFAKTYAGEIIKAQSAQNQQEFVKNYEEQMRNKVVENQSNLMRPNRGNLSPVDYVKQVLEKDKRNTEINGGNYYDPENPNNYTEMMIITMHENSVWAEQEGKGKTLTAEEIAEELKDIL